MRISDWSSDVCSSELFYEADIGDPDLLDDLEQSCRLLAEEDGAGRGWSRAHGYRGYTSYASLDDLPRRDPAFADLKRLLDRQVKAFAKACHFDLAKPLKLDSLWVNLLKPDRKSTRLNSSH